MTSLSDEGDKVTDMALVVYNKYMHNMKIYRIVRSAIQHEGGTLVSHV
jgi:hypothetical protein